MPKISETKLQFSTLHFGYYRKFTQQYEHGNHCRSLYLSVLLKKTPFKLQIFFMFSGNEIKTTNKIYDLSKNKICGFLLQSTYNYPYFLQIVSKILFPISSLFGQSQVTSS